MEREALMRNGGKQRQFNYYLCAGNRANYSLALAVDLSGSIKIQERWDIGNR